MDTDGKPGEQDALQDTGRASGAEGEKPSVKTYTQEQVDKILADAQSKKDKTIAQITKERDTFKAQAEEATTEREQATADREEADKALEDAVAGNAEPALVRKLKREVEAATAKEKAALKQERQAFEAEKEEKSKVWESQAERIAKAEKLEWDGVVFETAKAVDGDAVKLRATAEEFGITDPDKLTKLAKTLWPTKPLVDGEPASLEGKGGGLDFSHMTPEEKIDYGLKHPKKT